MPNPKPAILIATALGVAAGIVFSVKPWAAYLEQREEAKVVGDELKSVRAERARLEREEARSRSSVGRETRARDEGFRAKDEQDITLSRAAEKAPETKTPRTP